MTGVRLASGTSGSSAGSVLVAIALVISWWFWGVIVACGASEVLAGRSQPPRASSAVRVQIRVNLWCSGISLALSVSKKEPSLASRYDTFLAVCTWVKEFLDATRPRCFYVVMGQLVVRAALTALLVIKVSPLKGINNLIELVKESWAGSCRKGIPREERAATGVGQGIKANRPAAGLSGRENRTVPQG